MAENDIEPSSDEIKALYRALEDRKHLRLKMNTEKDRLLSDLAALKDKAKVEFRHNSNLKVQLHQLKQINEREIEKHEALSAIRCTLAKGNLNKVLSFSEGQIETYKRLNYEKQVDFEKTFQDHIDDQIRKRPLIQQYQRQEAVLAEVEQKLSIQREEKVRFMARMIKEQQINDLLLQQSILDMAYHDVRYYNLVEQERNPNKKISKPASLKPFAKVTMRKHGLHKSLEHQQIINEKQMHHRLMPAVGSSSMYQKMLDIKTGAVQNIDRNSRGRDGKDSMVQSNIKHLKSNVNSTKVPTEGSIASQTIQNGKKPKVTFADSEQKFSFERKSSKEYGGVSSSTSNGNLGAVDVEMKNDNEIQMCDNDENDVQMNDMNENISKSKIDDGNDRKSNLTSLQTGNRRPSNKNSNSAASSFDMDIAASGNAMQKKNNNSMPISNESFDFSDMGNDFNDFLSRFTKQ